MWPRPSRTCCPPARRRGSPDASVPRRPGYAGRLAKMSELRNDLVTGRPVLVAPGRSARPYTVAPAPPDPDAVANCPFCPGHEHETPPEVARRGDGAPDTPGWRIRVVPNLYPIVGGEHPGPGGSGAHEVIIFDPDHAVGVGGLDDDEVIELFRVLRERAAIH